MRVQRLTYHDLPFHLLVQHVDEDSKEWTAEAGRFMSVITVSTPLTDINTRQCGGTELYCGTHKAIDCQIMEQWLTETDIRTQLQNWRGEPEDEDHTLTLGKKVVILLSKGQSVAWSHSLNHNIAERASREEEKASETPIALGADAQQETRWILNHMVGITMGPMGIPREGDLKTFDILWKWPDTHLTERDFVTENDRKVDCNLEAVKPYLENLSGIFKRSLTQLWEWELQCGQSLGEMLSDPTTYCGQNGFLSTPLTDMLPVQCGDDETNDAASEQLDLSMHANKGNVDKEELSE